MKYFLYITAFLILGFIITCFALRNNDTFNTAKDYIALRLGMTQSLEDAEKTYEPKVRESLADNDFFKENGFPEKVFLFANKKAMTLSVYGQVDGTYSLIKTYPFTAFSGKLGLKLREGDLQIPEGIYEIESFNPNSLFHLSLRVNYPNAFDKQKGLERAEANLGGDIMIHGRSSSVGCIAIGDKAIEEVFILCLKASKKPINLIIAPDLINSQGFDASSIDTSAHYVELIEKMKAEMQKYENFGVKF